MDTDVVFDSIRGPDASTGSRHDLAAFTFIRKISQTTTVSRVTDDYIEDGRVHILQDKDIPECAAVYRILGPFLFGVKGQDRGNNRELGGAAPLVMVRLRNMTAIDATSPKALLRMTAQLVTWLPLEVHAVDDELECRLEAVGIGLWRDADVVVKALRGKNSNEPVFLAAACR